MSNLELWDKVRRVPEEHLKAFTRGGGFSGTAIKPMWAIKAMTEQFGPCGEGWGIDRPEFTVQPSGNEILVFCTVGVWHNKDGKPSGFVWGVGGDKVLAVNKNGPKPDDEAFKKAYTDAVGNALKFLGVGADIHMGLWDGNKYVDEAPADKPSNVTPMTKAESNPEYKRMERQLREIRDTGTLEDLAFYWKNNQPAIKALDPGWLKHLEEEKNSVKETLSAKVA